MMYKTVGEIPISDIKIGDRVISCDGREGYVAGIYNEKELTQSTDGKIVKSFMLENKCSA